MNVVERTPPRTAQTVAPELQGSAASKPEIAVGAPVAAPAREA